MTAWLGLFICWTVLAALDLALAFALWPHVVCPLFLAVALFATYHALLAVHRTTVERRFRRIEDIAKRELLLMDKCREHGNRLGYEWHRDQLGAACEEMRRISKP